jgi:nucleotide-binding universal stress UspA family protein
MPTKCIVVHMSDDPRHLPRLQLAVDLTARFDGHLNVVYAKPRADFPAGMIGRAASLAYLDDAEEEEHEHVAAIKGEVDAICAGLRSWEWHEEHGAVDKMVGRWAHLSDLLVFEQAPHAHIEDEVILHDSDHMVMSAGCPMLLVPTLWEHGSVGTRIMIAWKNGREAIGAVRGALAFLREADKVLVFAYDGENFADPPGSDMVAYLGYHGIEAELCGATEKSGKPILEAVKDNDCDLLVMGAYAHSRLRAMFVGGATDYIMRHTTVPVLMRH